MALSGYGIVVSVLHTMHFEEYQTTAGDETETGDTALVFQ